MFNINNITFFILAWSMIMYSEILKTVGYEDDI